MDAPFRLSRWRVAGTLVERMPLPLILAFSIAAQVPSADTILEKCRNRYNYAKSFQGELKIHVASRGYDDALHITLQSEGDGKGRSKRSAAAATETSTQGGKSGTSRRTVVDDGKTVFEADLKTLKYQTRPHAGDPVFGVFEGPLRAIRSILGTLTVREVIQDGKSVYQLSGTAQQAQGTVVIEKQTFNLVSMSLTRGTATALVNMQLTVSKQVFDRKLSPKAFTWKAPPGYSKAG